MMNEKEKSNKSNRIKVKMNGFDYWYDVDKNILYEKEDDVEGTYIYSKHITKDEREQILDFIKYLK